jgi:hypothetical protein
MTWQDQGRQHRRPTSLILNCMLLMASASAQAKTTLFRCPPFHSNKPLVNFDLRDGPPGVGQPQAPQWNYWVWGPVPRDEWARVPPYYLSCRYQGVPEPVSVELPRTVRFCEPAAGHNVECR